MCNPQFLIARTRPVSDLNFVGGEPECRIEAVADVMGCDGISLMDAGLTPLKKGHDFTPQWPTAPREPKVEGSGYLATCQIKSTSSPLKSPGLQYNKSAIRE